MRLLTIKQVELLFSEHTDGLSEEIKSDVILSGTFSIRCPHCRERLWGLGDKPRIMTDSICGYCEEEFHYFRTQNAIKTVEIILKSDDVIAGFNSF